MCFGSLVFSKYLRRLREKRNYEGSELGDFGLQVWEDIEDDDDLSFCCARQISLLRKLTSWDACNARGYPLSSSALGHLYATQKYGQHYRNKSKYTRILFNKSKTGHTLRRFVALRASTHCYTGPRVSSDVSTTTPCVTIAVYDIPHQM